MTEEHKKNIGNGNRGKKNSDETKRKIGISNSLRDFLEREKHHNCSEFQNGMYIHPNERKRRECAYCGHKVLFLYYSIWWDKNGNLHRIINPWLYIKSLFLPRTIVKISSGMDMEYFPRLQIKWFF